MRKTLILIIIICLYLFFLNNYKTEKFSKFHHTNKKIIKKLAEGMMLTHRIFNKHKIFYQIAYGSLLGSIRHKKIIPWDDDADLHIFLDDIKKIMKLKSEFNKYGWTLEKNWKLLKVKPLDKDGNVLEQAFIDLFIIDINNDLVNRCLSKTQKICKQMPKNHSWWHSWYNFPVELIRGRKLYSFRDDNIGYNFKMYGPKNGKQILKFWYGDDCLRICQSPVYDHNTGKYIKSEKISCAKLKSKFNI